MNLIPVETPEDFLLARQFILPHEETCVSLASLIRKKSDKLVFLTAGSASAALSAASPTLLGLLNLDSTLYYCIPKAHQLNAQELAALLTSCGLPKKPVRCISGEKTGAEVFCKSINLINKRDPLQTNLYKLMKFSSKMEVPSQILFNDDEIIRCTEKDMDLLFPLQEGFIKEEIALPGHKVTDAEVSIMLRQILKNQICLALLVDGEPVAKTNTNAIGFNCVQIGGVFTHPLYRRNGYAAALVLSLCNRSIRANRQPVLFVKEKNLPAYTLYKKLGFTECGHYEIVYF